VWLTHQPRSNMNNAVGYAPLAGFPARTALGTDGIGADLFSELQAGYFRSQEGHVGWGPARWAEVLAAGARLAAEQLGVSLGRVAPGFAADLVVLDPVPGPPLLADNLASALIFRFGAGMVRDVMVAGEWRLRDRMPVGVDVAELDRRAGETARAVWGRMRVTQNGS
jgi:cytosine/adenosine deaminase-related metal-dependent hydrolase